MTVLIKFAKTSDYQYFSMDGISSHKIMDAYAKDKPNFKNSHVALAQGSIIHGYNLENTQDYQVIRAEQIEKLMKSGMSATVANNTAKKAEQIAAVVHREFGDILKYCMKEVVVAIEDRGLTLKGKFDAIDINNKKVIDIKTTSNIKTFESSIEAFNYAIQAAFYLRLASVADGDLYKDFYWAIVDKKTLACKLVRCPDELISDANMKIDQYLLGQQMMGRMKK